MSRLRTGNKRAKVAEEFKARERSDETWARCAKRMWLTGRRDGIADSYYLRKQAKRHKAWQAQK